MTGTDYNAAIEQAIAAAVEEVNFRIEGKARDAVEEIAREVAREEIASLAGLVVRRTQDETLTRSPDRNMADDVVRDALARIFGEALNDFTTDTEPGS